MNMSIQLSKEMNRGMGQLIRGEPPWSSMELWAATFRVRIFKSISKLSMTQSTTLLMASNIQSKTLQFTRYGLFSHFQQHINCTPTRYIIVFFLKLDHSGSESHHQTPIFPLYPSSWHDPHSSSMDHHIIVTRRVLCRMSTSPHIFWNTVGCARGCSVICPSSIQCI